MKFSIVTITYNSEKFLEETIRSVLLQEHDDFEYLLVDGGSGDGTLDIIRDHAASDPRIRWISEPDRGIADAMNKGTAMSSGEVIAHLHSDDYYPDGSILTLVNAEFEKSPDSFWLTGGIYLVGPKRKILDQIGVRRYSYPDLLRSNILLHPSTFVKRSAFDRVGNFDISLKYSMDYDLWLRLGLLSDPLLLDHPLACFRVHGESLSTVEADKAFDEAWEIRKRFLGKNPLRIFRQFINYKIIKKSHRAYIASLAKDQKEAEK